MPELDPALDALQTWDAIAPAWERYRDRLFESVRPVSEWLVNHVDPQPGQTILELSAGPGETGFLAAERVGVAGHLISTDLAPAMVAAARRGAEARGLNNVECQVMDAQQIDLPDASVDGVISRFGLMLVPDPARAFSEARRVLRPGGRLAYAVWGTPDRNPWITLLIGALLENGHPPPGDPFGAGGLFSLSEPQRNRELLADTGFSDVRTEEITGLMRFDGLDDYWTLQTAVSGPLPALIASLTPDEMNSIRASLKAMMAPFQSGNTYDIPSLAVAVDAM